MNKKAKKKSIAAIVILTTSILFSTSNLHGQITIGSGLDPLHGALLDLKEEGETKKGLGMPRVELTDLTKLKMGTADEITEDKKEKHVGLVVYNINKIEIKENRICPGLHVWDGNQWQPIIPYDEPLEQRLLLTMTRSFEYLDPNNPTGWPSDKQPSKYQLGYIGTFTDSRPNDAEQTYHYARFYVGYKAKNVTSLVMRSYNCDKTKTPNWQDEGIETISQKTFDDGVWMTQHLRALKMPDGTSIINHLGIANSSTDPQYIIVNNRPTVSDEGVLYNWAAAINMGAAAKQTPDPGDVDQGGDNNDDIKLQGICPPGWSLPSDQEWTDLENGIVQKVGTTSGIFADALDAAATPVTYNSLGWRGSTHGQAMKSPTPIAGRPTNGKSNPYNSGGFDGMLAGYGSDGYATSAGISTNFWTASSNSSSKAWTRYLYDNSTKVTRTYSDRFNLFSVRCKKD